MKNVIVFFLFFVFPLNLSAGIIVLANGDNIEDASNISIQDQFVLYKQQGKNISVPIEEVTAILYDNGNYEEIQHTQSVSQETYSPIVEEPYNEISENPTVDNTVQYQREKKQKKTRDKTDSKETMQAWGNWIKSAFKGDKDGWNPAKNPLWNKESRAKYSNVDNTTEQQSPALSYPDNQVQPDENNW